MAATGNDSMELKGWMPDESQREVIAIGGGYHLVLAPPGCGKTQILAERVRLAHLRGVPYDDMLCLTFTNRAAREMRERVSQRTDQEGLDRLYVGNIHRFCSKFLFENSLIPAGASVIDDDDAVSILAQYLDEEEEKVKTTAWRLRQYRSVIFFSHFMYQLENRHPKALRLHPECVTSDDVCALRRLCEAHRMDVSPEAMIEIYAHNEFYHDDLPYAGYDLGERKQINDLLEKMRLAHAFAAYKREYRLLDFEDLLLFTYDALGDSGNFKKYSWIQVDEVQDLNPMQLAIIDRLSTRSPSSPANAGTLVYLGDGQQAIFSFMGAKADGLAALKGRCRGQVHYLDVNHRAPAYLLNVLNTYAEHVLGIDKALLPMAKSDGEGETAHGNLQLVSSDTIAGEYRDVAALARNFYLEKPKETTAIIVSSNNDAEAVSQELLALSVPHFKVSGLDLFSTPEMRLLLAHFSVAADDGNLLAWARLLFGLGVFNTYAAARSFVHRLIVRGMTPSDFLLYDDSNYVRDFAERYAKAELVVFDTETTGLNVFEDDIIQIAAVKVKGGKVVPGSNFCVHIATDKPIPEMLGTLPNPILKARQTHPLVSHEEALSRFMDYVGNAVLVAHNADYDYNILKFNLQRYLPAVDLTASCSVYYDTLRLLRLLEPRLKSYKLDAFRALHLFGLREDEAHLADVDVEDTVKVVAHCYRKASELLPSQAEYVARTGVADAIERLRKAYLRLFFHTRELLYQRPADASEPAMIVEMRYLHEVLVDDRRIKPLGKLGYVLAYLSHDIIDARLEPSLIEQLQRHILEINTLKEADLCNSTTIKDRVFVSTVHKAKGLEFDSVIVFDAVEGRYPNYYSRHDAALAAEDKRKFYVALSRARRRLVVSYSLARIDWHNVPQPRELTPFMKPILKYFG